MDRKLAERRRSRVRRQESTRRPIPHEVVEAELALAPLFSEQFGVNKGQSELAFVDIPVDTDVPLYVDPYAFKIGDSQWCVDCHNLVIDFFQKLVDAIRYGQHAAARRLLHNLREPNATHLGLSKGRPRGRGVGPLKAAELYERLKRSRAVQTGKLHDLSDCELMIPGISHDTISDMAINVIRGKLIEFTEEQCRGYSIPTRRVAGGVCWHPETSEWRSRYASLPVYERKAILLVPKECVRYKVSADHKEYYRYFVLEYLRQENLDSNTSLVRVLKSGKRKGESHVTTKDLEETHPCNKEFLFEFSEKHPEILQKYKKWLPHKSVAMSDWKITERVFETLGRPFGPDVPTIIQIGDTHVNNNNIRIEGDNIGGAVGVEASANFGDLIVYKNILGDAKRLDDDEKRLLLQAREQIGREELEDSDRDYVVDKLQELTAALDAQTRRPGLIRKIVDRVKLMAPTVASILTSIKVVADLVSGNLPAE